MRKVKPRLLNSRSSSACLRVKAKRLFHKCLKCRLGLGCGSKNAVFFDCQSFVILNMRILSEQPLSAVSTCKGETQLLDPSLCRFPRPIELPGLRRRHKLLPLNESASPHQVP